MKTLNTTLSNTLLIDILQQVRALIGQGKVANYIPALAEVPNHHLAMAVCTSKERYFQPVMHMSVFLFSQFLKYLVLP